MPDLGPFEGMSAEDGYHVEVVAIGEPAADLSLYFKVVACGDCVALVDSVGPEDAVVELAGYPDPQQADHAACWRLMYVMEGICRYFNLGGSWGELEASLARVRPLLPGGLRFPGYRYHSSSLNTDGAFEHIFTKDDGSGDAVLWVEYESVGNPGFIEARTLEQIYREQEAEEQRLAEAAYRSTVQPQGDRPRPQLPG